jgi:hypothetical protein
MKRIFRNNYIEFEFYWRGILFGFYVDDDLDRLQIIIPFLTLGVKLFMFKRKSKPEKF